MQYFGARRFKQYTKLKNEIKYENIIYRQRDVNRLMSHKSVWRSVIYVAGHRILLNVKQGVSFQEFY